MALFHGYQFFRGPVVRRLVQRGKRVRYLWTCNLLPSYSKHNCETYIGDLWLYNMENNTWVEMQLRLNDQRLWHQGVHIDNELLIFGGVRNNISVNSRPVVIIIAI